MKRTITSWLVSIFAGVIVGGFGGFLALKGLSANPADVTAAGSEGIRTGEAGTPGGVTPVSNEGAPGTAATSALSDSGTAVFQDEIRRAVNQTLEEGRRTAIVTATERVHRAVVTVFVTERITTRSIFPNIFSDFFSYGSPGSEQRQGLGSGVIISEDGYILTNAHVVENADNITVRFADGNELTGVVIDTDPRRDLAILKIDPSDDLPVAQMGDSEDIMIGEWVIALGSPFGFMIQDPQPSVSVGVVSAVGRTPLLPQYHSDRRGHQSRQFGRAPCQYARRGSRDQFIYPVTERGIGRDWIRHSDQPGEGGARTGQDIRPYPPCLDRPADR
jgi:S1-C subfamily serine protease